MRVALTDRFVAAAKVVANGARAEFFDTKVKGLSLRVSPTAKELGIPLHRSNRE
jgi:hypothetical protein